MNWHQRLPGEIIQGFEEEESRLMAAKSPSSQLPVNEDDDDLNYYVIPVPRIIEQTERGERVFDLFSRLLMDRIIILSREIDDRVGNLVVAQLLFLESQDPDREISIYINSPGGSVTAGMAIYDTMQLVKPRVSTVCVGQAASMGALLLLAGAKEHRWALPTARMMIHQPLGGARGSATEIDIAAKEILRIRERIYDIMVYHTGRTREEVEEACDRDRFMIPEEAKNFGIIDNIIESREALSATKS